MKFFVHSLIFLALPFFLHENSYATEEKYQIEVIILEGDLERLKDILPPNNEKNIPQSKFSYLISDKELEKKQIAITLIPSKEGTEKDEKQVEMIRGEERFPIEVGIKITAKIKEIIKSQSVLLDFEVTETNMIEYEKNTKDEPIEIPYDMPAFSSSSVKSIILLPFNEYVVAGGLSRSVNQEQSRSRLVILKASR